MEHRQDPGRHAATGASDEERLQQTLDAKAVLQQIVVDVTRRMAHRSRESVRDRLVSEIAAAGLQEQPERWVESTVEEIAAGHKVVLDARFQEEPPGPVSDEPESR
jgi:hypothetical protein